MRSASVRRTIMEQNAVEKSKKASKILECCCDGLSIREVPGCGLGLFATKTFLPNDYVCVYIGNELSEAAYRRRYGEEDRDRCYTFHFYYDSRRYVIDATNERGSYARMANHSWKMYNAEMKRVVVQGRPRLVLFATKRISVGHEIRYNYGDMVVKESADRFPWLKEIKEYNM